MQTRLSPEIGKASRFVRTALLVLVLAQAAVLQLSRPRLLVHADSNRLSLSSARQFPVTYKGSRRATAAMAGSPTALSMAAADLDGDGIGDLAIGFAAGGAGLIAIHHGNLDAFAPQSDATFWAIARGDFPSPYLPEADLVEIPTRPDFLAEGDLIGPKGSALAAAARGGNSISVLSRNDSGRMEVQQTIVVDGSITAMDSHDLARAKFGHLVVGVHTDSGSRLLIYTGSHEGLSETGNYPLPGDATSFASGNFDADGIPDLLVVAGGQISILHSGSNELDPVPTSFMVAAATAGRFVHDRGPLYQMALLATDGSLHIMAPDSFDSTPYTLQELQAHRRSRILARQRKQSSAAPAITRVPQRIVSWKDVESTSGVGVPDGSGRAPFLFRARMSNSPMEDVMLMNAAQIAVVTHPTAQAGAAQIMNRPDLGANVVAAVPVRANIDGRQSVVYMAKGDIRHTVVFSQANATFTVNTTADTLTANACANVDPGCSLREAIVEANAGTGTDTIMVPNGTYTLTIARKAGTQNYDALTGTLDVTQNVNILGGGEATTIIQAGTTSTNGVDKVFSFNQDITAYTAATVALSNLTIQNGFNRGNVGIGDGWGGAFDCDTGTNGNSSVTLTNVTLNNNTFTDGEGGAFANFNDVTGGTGLVTVVGGTISNNKAVYGGDLGNGGGIAVEDAASLTMTGTTITGNTTAEYGGGIYDVGSGFALAGGGFVNNQVTLHGVTISNNTTQFQGGGLISNGGGLTIDQESVISGNTAKGDGGGIDAGIYSNSNFPAFAVSFSNITVTGNSTTGTSGGGFGGGIKINGGFPSGTPFSMHFSRIAGNSGTTAEGQQFSWQGALGETINVQDNWWGTNVDPTTTTDPPIKIDTNGTTAGTLIYSPWLVFGLTANPTTVTVGGSDTSTLTASFLKDSSGGAVALGNLNVLLGVPISFGSAVHGTLSGAQTTIQSSATATATFTGTTIGLGTAQATVDAGTATSGNIVVNSTTTTAATNATATFNVAAQNVTLTANMTSASSQTVAGGTVTFSVFNGGTQIGSSVTSGTVSGGTASATFSLPAGTGAATYSVHATYNGTSTGSGDFLTSSDATHTLTVNSATTTTTASPATATFSASAQNVTLNATVTSSGGTVGAGTVTFTLVNGSSQVVGTATTSGTVTGGNASVSYALPAGTPVGTYMIQAAYTGNGNFGNSSDNTHTLVIGAATTTTGVNASATFSTTNQSVMLSATITSAAGTVNAGTMTFSVFNGGTQIGTSTAAAAVSNGSASANYTLPGGTSASTYTITASYTGAGGFNSSSDNTHTLTVSAATTTTSAMNAAATFSTSVQNVTLSATVTSAAGTVGVGTVTFTVLNASSQVVGTATTSGTVAAGNASVSYALPASTPAAVYTIQAAYTGTANFGNSNDSTHTLTIGSSTSTTTTTASSASAVFSTSSQPVTLAATVTSSGGTVNGGTMTFSVFNGGTQIGSSTPGTVSNGSVMVSYVLPGGTGAGTYSIVASYGGTGSFGASSDNTHVLSVSATSTMTAGTNATVTFSASSQVVLLSATVASGGGIVNGGMVTFTVSSGMTTVGSPVSGAVSGGTASANYTLPAATGTGPYTITAAYSGTQNFTASSDSTHTLTVNPVSAAALTVVSFHVLFGTETYNVTTSNRNRLPWQITGIQVVFSEAVTSANINSLTGFTNTGFTGLGTNTLTWTISPIALGNFTATLLATGGNALMDANANALNNGSNATQALKVLWGDVNDDGVVNSQDLVLTNNATVQPYNIIYDANGDGLVNSADVLVVRARLNTSLP